MIQSPQDLADALVAAFAKSTPSDEAHASEPVVVADMAPETVDVEVETVEGRRFRVRVHQL